jgi:hypothetical protein
VIDVPVARMTNRNVERAVRRQPVSWQRYHEFRNDILRALQAHGSVGPMGLAPITDAKDGPPSPWPIADQDPTFFVMDDQWHDTHLWSHIECNAVDVHEPVLAALLAVMSRWKGALIHISLGTIAKGVILVCSGRLLVQGPLFPRSCTSARDVVVRCQRVEGEPPRGRRPTSGCS